MKPNLEISPSQITEILSIPRTGGIRIREMECDAFIPYETAFLANEKLRSKTCVKIA